MLKCQCCKQHFLGQDSRIPLLFPSQEMRSLPGHSVAFHEPTKAKNMIVTAASFIKESYLPYIAAPLVCRLQRRPKKQDCTGSGWPGSLRAQRCPA